MHNYNVKWVIGYCQPNQRSHRLLSYQNQTQNNHASKRSASNVSASFVHIQCGGRIFALEIYDKVMTRRYLAKNQGKLLSCPRYLRLHTQSQFRALSSCAGHSQLCRHNPVCHISRSLYTHMASDVYPDSRRGC